MLSQIFISTDGNDDDCYDDDIDDADYDFDDDDNDDDYDVDDNDGYNYVDDNDDKDNDDDSDVDDNDDDDDDDDYLPKETSSEKPSVVKSLVWSVTLYGCETWTLRKDDCKRLEAFEMWIWRRMFKIKWIERLSNEEVLVIAGETRSLLNTIKDRQRKWIGHILRHDNMMRDVTEGRVDGKRMRGGQRTKMLDMIMNRYGNTYKATKIKAQDRNEW